MLPNFNKKLKIALNSIRQAFHADNMIENQIVKSLEFWQVPGASIAIIKDNKVIMAKGFGYTSLAKTKDNEVTADTLFPIASLTKSFTAIAGGIFAEQQQISLNSTIYSLWPSFKLSDAYATSHLTLLDCLSMRAGLMGFPLENNYGSCTSLPEKVLAEELSKLSLPFGFRGCFSYQNMLYSIIGHIIELKTGRPWASFVKESLLDKLNMGSTTTDHDTFLTVKNKAFPHQWINNAVKQVPFERLDVIAPGAGLSSNANDMAKWLNYLLDHHDSSIVKSTLTPQTVVQPEEFPKRNVFFPKSHFLTYGMGWYIHDYNDLIIYQDPGLTDGMNGLMSLIPELNLGIVILDNLESPFFSHSLLFQIIDCYHRDEVNHWNQHFLDISKKT